MEPKSKDPLISWRSHHPELMGTEAWHRVDTMIYVQVAVSVAGSIFQTWEAYYADRSLPVPDIVKYVAEYGYTRLMVHGWTELPIEVLPDQIEAWQGHGLGTTFNEFFEINISGLAGGFMELAVKDPAFTSSTIRAAAREVRQARRADQQAS